MAKLTWYKRDADAALGGMMGLTLEQRGAYNTVLDLIYSTNDKLADDDHFIAGWCQVDVRVWKRIKKVLIDKGKISTSGGLLRNFRSTCEVKSASQQLEQKVENGRYNGIKSGIIRKQNNDLAKADLQGDLQGDPEGKTNRIRVREEEERVVKSAAFETLEKIINSLPELDGHPIKANPNISPIFQLVQEGFDVQTEIIPVIRSVLVKARHGTMRSWAYFVDRIRENRIPKKNNYANPLSAPSPADWQKRLDLARQVHDWDVKNWGPMPGQAGCLVPQNLLIKGDGHGWIEWKPHKITGETG